LFADPAAAVTDDEDDATVAAAAVVVVVIVTSRYTETPIPKNGTTGGAENATAVDAADREINGKFFAGDGLDGQAGAQGTTDVRARTIYAPEKRRRRIDGETTRCSALQATGRSRTLVRLAATEHGRLAATAAPPASSSAGLEPHTVRRRSGVGRGGGNTGGDSACDRRILFPYDYLYVVSVCMLLYRVIHLTRKTLLMVFENILFRFTSYF